eukprot:635652-Karenia_brevis.AAC.1
MDLGKCPCSVWERTATVKPHQINPQAHKTKEITQMPRRREREEDGGKTAQEERDKTRRRLKKSNKIKRLAKTDAHAKNACAVEARSGKRSASAHHLAVRKKKLAPQTKDGSNQRARSECKKQMKSTG